MPESVVTSLERMPDKWAEGSNDILATNSDKGSWFDESWGGWGARVGARLQAQSKGNGACV